MKTWIKVVIWALAITFALVWAVLGYAITAFHNHYLSHVHFQDRSWAKRWNLSVVNDAIAFSSPPSSTPIHMSDGWIEQGFYRELTIPFTPFPAIYFGNRYSFHFNGSFFGRIHFDLKHPSGYKVRMLNEQRPTYTRAICSQGDSGFSRCEITVWDSTIRTFRGHLETTDKHPVVGSQFEISVSWLPMHR